MLTLMGEMLKSATPTNIRMRAGGGDSVCVFTLTILVQREPKPFLLLSGQDRRGLTWQQSVDRKPMVFGQSIAFICKVRDRSSSRLFLTSRHSIPA